MTYAELAVEMYEKDWRDCKKEKDHKEGTIERQLIPNTPDRGIRLLTAFLYAEIYQVHLEQILREDKQHTVAELADKIREICIDSMIADNENPNKYFNINGAKSKFETEDNAIIPNPSTYHQANNAFPTSRHLLDKDGQGTPSQTSDQTSMYRISFDFTSLKNFGISEYPLDETKINKLIEEFKKLSDEIKFERFKIAATHNSHNTSRGDDQDWDNLLNEISEAGNRSKTPQYIAPNIVAYLCQCLQALPSQILQTESPEFQALAKFDDQYANML